MVQDRYRRELFNGDLADWDAMTRFYGEQFLSDNVPRDVATSPAGRCPDADPGEDVFLGGDPQWFCMNTATIEYEDERIVSYRTGFYGFFVGNITTRHMSDVPHSASLMGKYSGGKLLPTPMSCLSWFGN